MREDEKRVAEDFAELVLGALRSAVEGRRDVLLDPDAWVRTPSGVVGLEMTSAFDEDERGTLEQESRFLKDLEREVAANAPPTSIQFRLVVQDDADEIIHRPARGMEAFPAMGRWLDGLFIELFTDREPQRLVVLNQRATLRPSRGLFPRGRELASLARELVAYAQSLESEHFQALPFPGQPRIHHVVATDSVGARHTALRSGWDLVSLNAKLTDAEKYNREALSALYLLIHNYVSDFERALRVWHEYWHERDAIIRLLATRAASRTTPLFDDVFLLDYSHRLGGVEIYRIGDGEIVKVPARGASL